ncbi:MAG: gliding motility associated protein GldN [Cognaticolwellia sp.]|jgi:gliding motility associated protien GldN
MKVSLKILSLCFLASFFVTVAYAQPTPEPVVTESSNPEADTPLDGVYERKIIEETAPLKYDNIREADVFWEKRIWRVLDVREKMNKPFVYPENPFINIMLDAAKEEKITLYSTIDDKFTEALGPNEASTIGVSVDTIITFDPETFEEQMKVVRNELNWEDIKRFRLKEVWFFDEETSTMQVRILGIAPLREVYDDQGNFKYEQPMFWAYYPELRDVLAREASFNPLNDATRMSWEDIFEMRYFSSYIYKESNVYDRRIQDYMTGVDILLEADKIKNQIFNFEHDLWSY